MNTMQKLFSMLRGLAIAGLCTAGLAAAAPAQTQPPTSRDAGPSSLSPQGAIPTFVAPPPLLVAPTCPTCWIWRGLIAPGAVTTPSPPLFVAPRGCGSSCQDPSNVEYALKYRTPLRLAGGDPTIVRDTCTSSRCVG